jgi:murein DD-endopeptidase MepM/ murein hydrolase activator NlpD
MMRALAWACAAVGGSALFALGSCNDGAQGSAAMATPAPTAIAPRPVSSPPEPVPRSADFTLAGQFTQGGWLRGTAPPGATSLTIAGRDLPLASDGTFFAAFDRDAGTSALLTARLANGTAITRPLAISPRAWNIEHIPLGPRPGTPPDQAFLRRRAGEVAQINAARATPQQSDGWRQTFIWPLRGRISGRFGAQRIYPAGPANYHSGLDIAGATGTPFVAPADGVVIFAAASPLSLEGRLLMIDHGMGLNSAFLHCSSLDVAVGDHVRQGQVIGRVGMTGRATGPHLHWGIKWHEARLDPLLFVGGQ